MHDHCVYLHAILSRHYTLIVKLFFCFAALNSNFLYACCYIGVLSRGQTVHKVYPYGKYVVMSGCIWCCCYGSVHCSVAVYRAATRHADGLLTKNEQSTEIQTEKYELMAWDGFRPCIRKTDLPGRSMCRTIGGNRGFLTKIGVK